MKEMIRRLKAWPFLTFELGLASFIIGVLGLASPIFVIQVLRRYVSSGIGGTLFTLVTGVLVAIVMEFAFRQVRLRLARGLNIRPEAQLSGRVFATLTDARMGALDRVAPAQKREMVSHLGMVQQTYSPNNITLLFDVPLCILYLAVIFMLKPVIAVCVFFLLVVVCIFSAGSRAIQEKPTQALQQASAKNRNLTSSTLIAADSVRAFNAASHLKEEWGKQQGQTNTVRRRLVILQGLLGSITSSLQALMTVIVIALGAWLTVRGEMTVAAMIGANILAGRAMAPILRFTQFVPQLSKARQSLEKLEEFCELPREPHKGTAKKKFSGRIEFADLAFGFGGTEGPLYESISVTVPEGGLLVVTGANGTGKTTLSRLVLGLLQPTRGRILVDGIDLRQAQPAWWRKQVIYLPQEPVFFDGTIRENLETNGVDLQEEDLTEIANRVGLKQFLDESKAGFDTPLMAGGRNLALGIRRRIAFARALVTKGQLVVLDEPVEGLDPEGRAVVGKLVSELSRERKTLIVCSHNPNMMQGLGIRLNLNIKPVPEISLPNPNKAVGPGSIPDVQEPQV
jgi:ATP-binding cassette subfamily C protein LapB